RTKNGVIEFVASEKVELGAQSLVQAAGDSSDLAGPSDGGAIRIKSAQSFEDHVGSRIEVTGGVPGGHGGSVEISASSMTAVRSQLEGRAVPGWRAGDLLFDPTDITLTMGSGTGTLPSGTVNAGDPPSSLRLDVNSAFANFSQIHLQATHDITLEPGTTWD